MHSRFLIASFTAIFIASHVHAAAPPQLSAFSFQGFTTSTPLDLSHVAHCGPVHNGVTSCIEFNNAVVAGQNVEQIAKEFYGTKLFSVWSDFPSAGFKPILEAFTVKYGNPTIEKKKWQSQGGGVFENVVATWRFKDGTLQLESIGSSLHLGHFQFVDPENAPPAKKPTVDF